MTATGQSTARPIELGNSLTLLRHKVTANVYATNKWQMSGHHHAVNFTNGEFCYLVHDQITTEHYDVLRQVIVRGVHVGGPLPGDPPTHVFAICPECKWRTRDDLEPQHRYGCSRPAPTKWVSQEGDLVPAPIANAKAARS